jgi:hypothetical protein
MDPVRAEQIALGQLNPGERLLWSGSPAIGGAAVGGVPVTVFGIVFTAFAVTWIGGAISATGQAGGPWSLFPLFGVPFLLIGIALLLGPLWYAIAAAHTVYAVTEGRALIITGSGGRMVRSFTSNDVEEVVRVERPDGSGSVYFAIRTTTSSRGFTRRARIGFVGIPEVRRVEQLIRDHVQREAA